MKLHLTALTLLATIVSASCASSNVEMIDASTARISMRGIAVSDTASVRREAAKTTKTLGFRYFSIVLAQDDTHMSKVYTPGQNITGADMQAARMGGSNGMMGGGGSGEMAGSGAMGGSAASSFTTSGTTQTVSTPGAKVVIRMFKDGEVDPKQSGILDAHAVLAQT